MQGKLTYFGLAILLLGVVCLGVGEVNLANVTSIDVGDNKILGSVWYFTCNLTSGNTYWLYIESGSDWGQAFQEGGLTSAQPVNVTITSPGGGVTSLQAFFYSEPSTSPYYRQGIPPAIVGVTYENVDYTGLSVDLSSPKIRFSAKESGNYTARVIEGDWFTAAPNFFVFYEEVSPNRETYTLLASGGGIVGAFGGVTLVVGIFGKERVKRKRTHR